LDDTLIGNWLESIPIYFQENTLQAPKFTLCHSIMRWRYRNFRILMYRPFLVQQVMFRTASDRVDPSVEVVIQRCLSAARESVYLISDFWTRNEGTMMACWYGLYFLFQAILIPVICLRNEPSATLAVEWRDQIVEAIRVIESMAQLNPTAQRCLGVIRSLCGSYLVDNVNERRGPTQESPQTQLTNLYPLLWPTLEVSQIEGFDSIM
jgi:transcriptional regulatory protein GAL4